MSRFLTAALVSVFLAWRKPADYHHLSSHTPSTPTEAITTTTSTSTITATNITTNTSRGRSSWSPTFYAIFPPTRPAWAEGVAQAEAEEAEGEEVAVEEWGWQSEGGTGQWPGAGEEGRRWGSWRDVSRQTGKCSTSWSGKTWVCTDTKRVNTRRNDCFAVATGILCM